MIIHDDSLKKAKTPGTSRWWSQSSLWWREWSEMRALEVVEVRLDIWMIMDSWSNTFQSNAISDYHLSLEILTQVNIQVDEVVVPQGDVSANSASGWEDSPGRAPRLPMIRFFQESTDNFQDDIADFLHKCRIVGGQRGITIMEDDRGRCCLLSMGDRATSAAMKWWSISSP